MWQKIEIKPNDQSWVGKLVFDKDGGQYKILFVGTDRVVLLNDTESREDYPLLEYLELYEEPSNNIYHTDCNQQVSQNDVENIGHHCSGKCTKLIGSISVNQEENEIAIKAELGFEEYKKEKECEHDWEYCELPNGECSKKILNCKKCPALKSDEDPFWLKVGNVIKEKDKLLNIKIIELDEDKIWVEHPSGGRSFFNKKYITQENFKKIKLVSPAMIYTNETQKWRSSNWCYSNYDEAYADCMTPERKIIWPAKDQFGREIWYEVDG